MNKTKQFINRYFKYYLEAYMLFKQSADMIDVFNKDSLKLDYNLILIDKDSSQLQKNELISLWNNAYYSSEQLEKSEKEVLIQLSDGDVCCALTHENRVVGMSWFGFKSALIRLYFAKIISHESTFLITHHLFILPSARGWGAQRYLLSYGVNQLRNIYKIKKLFVFVGINNFSSIKNCLKDYAEYRIVYHLRVETPFIKLNLYPKKNINTWRDCEK